VYSQHCRRTCRKHFNQFKPNATGQNQSQAAKYVQVGLASSLPVAVSLNRSLQQEDAVLSVKVPLPINRLSRVRQWLSEKVAALDAEEAALEGKRMVSA